MEVMRMRRAAFILGHGSRMARDRFASVLERRSVLSALFDFYPLVFLDDPGIGKAGKKHHAEYRGVHSYTQPITGDRTLFIDGT